MAGVRKIARVIVDLSLDRTFDYLIGEELAGQISVGSQVTVPFGHSLKPGCVVEITSDSEWHTDKLKTIRSLPENRTRIPEKLLELGMWIADYYCCSKEQAVRCLLPGAVRSGRVKTRKENFYTLADRKAAEAFVADNSGKKNAEQRIRLLKIFLDCFELSQSELQSKNSGTLPASPLATLLKAGLLKKELRSVERGIFEVGGVIASTPRKPTAEQQSALDMIKEMLRDNTDSHVQLLWGVTNSGKTEVYMQSIELARQAGKSSIVLVPEISLTPQTVRRFRARFGDNLSVLHSGLTDGERFDQWNKIDRGEADIVIGARSALFAPLHNLGLIIVDEEHEPSYKQSETPRYHARDVAVMRGKLENAVVILGSATPSAESMENARSGKYRLCQMPSKVENHFEPVIHVVDQRLAALNNAGFSGDNEAEKRPGASLFSPFLIEKIYDRLHKGEQSMLFLNRRGYARTLVCEKCHYEAHCPDCSVPMCYSQRRASLDCHWCGHAESAPSVCPVCGDASIRFVGSGTEKIENIAGAIFPGAKIGRMDSDTMKTRSDYEKILEDFRRGRIDILIGTQMIAKGLHFPNVTLVGILNADQSLSIPDFRAPERTFQLLTQVAGRAGRGDAPGEVVIQTYNPDNEVISAAAKSDFAAFQDYDLTVRKIMKYPPFSHLIVLHFDGEDEARTADMAMQLTDALRPLAHDKVKITGPETAPVERIKGKYRFITVIRGEKLQYIRKALRDFSRTAQAWKDVSFYIDADAQNLM